MSHPDLLKAIQAVETFIRRFVILQTPEDYLTLALWVVHTYALGVFDYTPYLWITSPTRQSGKSRVIEVLELLVLNPWQTDRTTSAALVRKLGTHPTLLLDEIDQALTSTGDEYSRAIIGVLNSGFRRGKMLTLSVKKGDDWEPKDFPVFGAKVICGIGKRIPHTVKDRSIRIAMQRKHYGQEVESFRLRELRGDEKVLRALLIKTISPDVLAQLGKARPVLPKELSDRAKDIWEPLVAIADLSGLGDLIRAAAVNTTHVRHEEDGDVGIQLLYDVKTIFDEKGLEFLPSENLVQHLVSSDMAHRPWQTHSHGRSISAHAVATLLDEYGIEPIRHRLAGNQCRGYLRADIDKAARIYL